MSGEISHNDAMQRLLGDEKYADVWLEGTDGVTVPAVRAFLGARSSVFHTLLYGRFAESQQSTVKISFPSYLIKELVTYIYTGEPIFIYDETMEMQPDFHLKVAALAEAGHYFQLEKLRNKALKVLDDFASLNVDSTLEVVNICCKEFHSLCDTNFVQVAIRRVFYLRDNDLVDRSMVRDLCPLAVQKILENRNIVVGDASLFAWLLFWVEAEPLDQSRKAHAKEFIARGLIDLSLVPINFLQESVEPSGLVETAKLLEAYKVRGLKLEREKDSSIGFFLRGDRKQLGAVLLREVSTVRGPVWKASGSPTLKVEKHWSPEQVFSALKCEPFVEGVHTWKLVIDFDSFISFCTIGVTAPGSACHAIFVDLANITVRNTTVFVTLDMTKKMVH